MVFVLGGNKANREGINLFGKDIWVSDDDGKKNLYIDGASLPQKITSWQQLEPVAKIKDLITLTIVNIDVPSLQGAEFLLQNSALRAFSIANSHLRAIEGIEAFPHLTYVDVSGNEITDISPLTKTRLGELYCGNNPFKNIEDLGSLPLTMLGLKGSKLTSTDWLKNLSNMTSLSVEECGLQSLEFVQSLKQLEVLRAQDNAIVDMSPLSSMAKLNKLFLNKNQIAKIAGLETCAALKILYLENNQINAIEGLDGCTALENLYLEGNQIPRIQGLARLQSLEVLSLKNNKIQKIEGLGGLHKLRYLNLAGNPLAKDDAKLLGKIEKKYEKEYGLPKDTHIVTDLREYCEKKKL